MAFDYGSIDLGLKNPFKLEGKVVALRGLIQSVIGVSLLVSASATVQGDSISGWILMLFGMLILAFGIRSLSSGIYSTLRYFVGRNHPTSLARNYSKSEQSTAQQEANDTAYSAKELEEMLMGRKNSTFTEPTGFLSRLLHSIVPKLLFLPYPLRNLAQRIFGSWINTAVALMLYGVVAFVSLAGFAGEAGLLMFPVYTVFLMLYVLFTWRAAGRTINRSAEHAVESLGSGSLAKVISFSFIIPIALGLGFSQLMTTPGLEKEVISQFFAELPDLHSSWYVFGVIILAGISSAMILFMLKARMAIANPSTEVSELRENWQESVHPNEIFINLDNLVMANRRYKEVPNRVYRELDPQLVEQVEGKGGFNGEMIQEIQPKHRAVDLGKGFTLTRLVSLISSNLLYLITLAATVLFAYSLVDVYKFISQLGGFNLKQLVENGQHVAFMNTLATSLHWLILIVLIKSFAKLLDVAAHLFFAEIQFESLLIYFKCEGTFTESKISTGTGIHDSTRSENTLIRSSITPWVIVSRVITSTFAATGMKNLEHPRHILEMHKDEHQLSEIKSDVVSFLKDRESIASITSERDLGNASQIYQLNEQTRAVSTDDKALANQEAEAAGFIRQEADTEER